MPKNLRGIIGEPALAADPIDPEKTAHVRGTNRTEGVPTVRYGRAVLHRPLGAGGMGEVHLGFHEVFQIPVVIKLLPERSHDPDLRERFLREARVAARLEHPNIVRVFDAGTEYGRLFLVMEYVEGQDLEAYTRDHGGTLPVPEALSLIGQAARGLAYAHAQGVVHRDIKPANLMRRSRDETVKILDFGLAHASCMDPFTDPAVLMGTLPYMSQEQLLGHAGLPSDVYALGVSLYRLLAGKVPAGGTVEEMLRYHREGRPPSLSSLRPVAASVERLVLAMLSPEPRVRPTAELVASEAERLRVALEGDAGPTTVQKESSESVRRLAEALRDDPSAVEATRRGGVATKSADRPPRRAGLRVAGAAVLLAAILGLVWKTHRGDLGPRGAARPQRGSEQPLGRATAGEPASATREAGTPAHDPRRAVATESVPAMREGDAGTASSTSPPADADPAREDPPTPVVLRSMLSCGLVVLISPDTNIRCAADLSEAAVAVLPSDDLADSAPVISLVPWGEGSSWGTTAHNAESTHCSATNLSGGAVMVRSTGFGHGSVERGQGIRFVLLGAIGDRAYVYVFNIDAREEVYCLYPDAFVAQYEKKKDAERLVGPAPGNPVKALGKELLVPPPVTLAKGAAVKWFEFDDTVGWEWFLVCVSSSPVQALDDARRRIAEGDMSAADMRTIAAECDELPWSLGPGPRSLSDVRLPRLPSERALPPGVVYRDGFARVVWQFKLEHKSPKPPPPEPEAPAGR